MSSCFLSSLPKCIYIHIMMFSLCMHISNPVKPCGQRCWHLKPKHSNPSPSPSLFPAAVKSLIDNPCQICSWLLLHHGTKTLNNHEKTRFYDSTSENILKVQYWCLLMTKDWMVLREKHLVVLLDWWSWMCACVDASILHTSYLFWMFWQGSLKKGWKSLMDEVTLHL